MTLHTGIDVQMGFTQERMGTRVLKRFSPRRWFRSIIQLRPCWGSVLWGFNGVTRLSFCRTTHLFRTDWCVRRHIDRAWGIFHVCRHGGDHDAAVSFCWVPLASTVWFHRYHVCHLPGLGHLH